ncbi:MAG: NAD(P)H-dependent flavin oxidoreductase [Candidatus Hodarchaeales archaeon]|jgi:enoyl-[acyl-carrier protein] reductase II
MVIETNITKMLGIKHPIIAAPMGPFYTTKLTIEVSEAGGLGVLSHTGLISEMLARRYPLDVMKENMLEVVEHTDKPFGFNIRTSRTERPEVLCTEIPKFIMENPKIRDQCVYAVTSAGSSRMLPESKSFQKLKESGSNIKHFHVAPALWLADKCVNTGVDGLVITGGEGGGHQSYERVSTLVLLQQTIQKYPDYPVVACGGFATGQGLAAALAMGAGAVAMGTRFIASEESEFHETYKNIVPPAKAQDTVLTTGGLGLIRLWRNDYSTHHDLVANKEEKMAQEAAMSPEAGLELGKKYELAYQGNINDGAVPLGQSTGTIDRVEPVSEIINRIMKDAENNLKNAYQYLK